MRQLESYQHTGIGVDIRPGPLTTHIASITDQKRMLELMKDVDAVIHTATLHKPHVATHSKQDFIDVNLTGSLTLLEAAAQHGIKRFVFTSTTSAFGDAMRPKAGESAVWVTEAVQPIAKNIYGSTKTAAEDLCLLFHRNHGMNCLVLRTSRFFLEADDQKKRRDSFDDLNLKANEFLYRRVDLQDAVDAHFLAVDKAPEIGFAKYIISATTPFRSEHLQRLNADAAEVVREIYPEWAEIYQEKNWKMLSKIGRVYVNEKARQELGWQPKHDFQHVLNSIKAGQTFFSPVALACGIKGYHGDQYPDGMYPVEEA